MQHTDPGGPHRSLPAQLKQICPGGQITPGPHGSPMHWPLIHVLGGGQICPLQQMLPGGTHRATPPQTMQTCPCGQVTPLQPPPPPPPPPPDVHCPLTHIMPGGQTCVPQQVEPGAAQSKTPPQFRQI